MKDVIEKKKEFKGKLKGAQTMTVNYTICAQYNYRDSNKSSSQVQYFVT